VADIFPLKKTVKIIQQYLLNDRPALDRPRAAQVGRGRRPIVDRSQPAHHAKYILANICHNYKGEKSGRRVIGTRKQLQ
jgi:hypothetical protein